MWSSNGLMVLLDRACGLVGTIALLAVTAAAAAADPDACAALDPAAGPGVGVTTLAGRWARAGPLTLGALVEPDMDEVGRSLVLLADEADSVDAEALIAGRLAGADGPV